MVMNILNVQLFNHLTNQIVNRNPSYINTPIREAFSNQLDNRVWDQLRNPLNWQLNLELNEYT